MGFWATGILPFDLCGPQTLMPVFCCSVVAVFIFNYCCQQMIWSGADLKLDPKLERACMENLVAFLASR